MLGKNFIAKILRRNNVLENKLICEINTEKGKSVQQKTYPIAKSQEEGVAEAIRDLLEKKYIRNSNSTWINNMRPVKKPNGKYRITVNFIQLNKLVELDKYSLPKIEEMIYNLRGMKYFSKLDLKDGFFQVPLAEKDKYKTAFRFKHKLYEWNVMPMGFKNSPAIFQRVMDHALGEEIGVSCYVYVDDILVFGRDEKMHDEGLKRVLKLLQKHNLKINSEKTVTKAKEAEFVGYIIKENEIRPIIDSKEAIENYKQPATRNEVQRFIGLVNYYRKFVPNCSMIAEPITSLLSTKIDFKWNGKQEEAFIKLKKILLSDLVLSQPDFKKRFTLETDASSQGLGAILSQEFPEGKRPILFLSRKLKPEELKYSISEKECLAALWAMEKLKYFLFGRDFNLITDHKALEALNKGKIRSQRIERWFERLSMFSYVVIYKRGEEISHVDALSRSLYCEEEFENTEVKNIDEVISLQECSTDPSEKEKEYLIMKKHVELVHRGCKVVEIELRKEYDWENLSKLTRRVLQKCMKCKEYNSKKNAKIKFVTSFEKGEKFAVDIIGPINKVYIITGIDYSTRKGFAKVISSRSVANVLNFLKETFQEIRFKFLIMDQAKEFLSKEVSKWAEENNVKLHYTTPFHHQSNGRVERFNRTLQEGIFKSKKNEKLKELTSRVVKVYNNVWHSGIGMSPLEAEKEENHRAVCDWMFRKQVEFNKSMLGSKPVTLTKGQPVIIKRETGLGKGKSRYHLKGIIYDVLGNNTYNVLVKDVLYKRHFDQIKILMDMG